MKLLRRILRECVSLFVDDVLAAGLTLAWIAFACIALPLVLPRDACGLTLCAGFLALFVRSLL